MARSISRKARVDIPWVSWKDKLFWIVEFLRFRTAEPTWVRMGFIVKGAGEETRLESEGIPVTRKEASWAILLLSREILAGGQFQYQGQTRGGVVTCSVFFSGATFPPKVKQPIPFHSAGF